MGLISEWPPARSVTVLCHTCMWDLWAVQPLLRAKGPLCHVLGITASPCEQPLCPLPAPPKGVCARAMPQLDSGDG